MLAQPGGDRDDPSLLIPKRFGVGWTVNLARPVGWVYLAAIATVIAAVVVHKH